MYVCVAKYKNVSFHCRDNGLSNITVTQLLCSVASSIFTVVFTCIEMACDLHEVWPLLCQTFTHLCDMKLPF